jgi:hypothetical protein
MAERGYPIVKALTARPIRRSLPRMLERVGVELTTARPVEARRLRQRAQLILDLLAAQGQSPIPPGELDRGRRLGSLFSGGKPPVCRWLSSLRRKRCR